MPDGANKGSFVQGYNVQIAVDSATQVILAAEVTRETWVNGNTEGCSIFSGLGLERVPLPCDGSDSHAEHRLCDQMAEHGAWIAGLSHEGWKSPARRSSSTSSRSSKTWIHCGMWTHTKS